MKKYVYIMIFALVSVACSVVGGPRLKEVRNISNFSRVDVSAGLEVVLTQADSTSVVVEASEDFLPQIETRNNGETLIVVAKPKPFSMGLKHATIYITTPKIESLSIGSGCDVITTDTLRSEKLQIDVASGSQFKGNLYADMCNLSISSGSSLELSGKFTDLNVSVASGSNLDLQGSANNMDVKISSGSEIEGFGFTAKNLVCKVSSGSSLEMTISETLDVKASSGSSIRYKGDAKIVNSDISIGARLSKEK